MLKADRAGPLVSAQRFKQTRSHATESHAYIRCPCRVLSPSDSISSRESFPHADCLAAPQKFASQRKCASVVIITHGCQSLLQLLAVSFSRVHCDRTEPMQVRDAAPAAATTPAPCALSLSCCCQCSTDSSTLATFMSLPDCFSCEAALSAWLLMPLQRARLPQPHMAMPLPCSWRKPAEAPSPSAAMLQPSACQVAPAVNAVTAQHSAGLAVLSFCVPASKCNRFSSTLLFVEASSPLATIHKAKSGWTCG
jgi:hypothetical protein